MIRIITGWGNQGGSSVALSNLCNAFNESGLPCILYAPHQWILSKCKSSLLTDGKIDITKSDSLIFHFRIPPRKPPCHKVILSCHEQSVFEISKINLSVFDKVHFVSETQKKYHSINHPSFIIPNVLNDLKANPKPSEKIAGIIGSIDRNKQCHISIHRALKDGFKKILLYGMITDVPYFENDVKPFIDGVTVQYMGFCENKQKMYDQITDVYHSSLLETWGYIKGECKLTGTRYHGNSATDGYWEMSKEDIVNAWRKELEL